MFSLTFGAIVKRIFSAPRIVKMSDLQDILANNKAAEELLTSLKQELKTIQNEQVHRKIAELQAENETLRKQVDSCLKKLVTLEVAHGKMQIPVPTPDEVRNGGTVTVKMETLTARPEAATSEESAIPTQAQPSQRNENKPPKEKKAKKEKPAGEATQAIPAEEPPIHVGRLDMRVGRIVDVSRHPNADTLYVESIDCGEPNPRTVISGLAKFVPIKEMENRLVVALCNLKPAKMRGILSEAMVMCASTPDKVEILAPPEGAVPGDLVHVDGFPRVPDAVMNPKKKIFETVAPDLKTNGELVACYKDGPFVVPGKGPVKAQTLKNVQVK